MINSTICNLFDQAERAGAALMICNARDQIVKVNRIHSQIYNFIDFSLHPTFEDATWRCIDQRKMADPFVYQDPQAWLSAAARARKTSDYAQFITRHTDGRVLMVCYERVKGVTDWWYQVRIDITQELKARFKQEGVPIGPACWEGTFAPLARNSTVPITNVLEAMPAAAALIMRRGKILDANRALFTVLRNGDGLLKIDDRVVAREPSEQAEFQRRLARFFEPGGQRSPVAMRISRLDSTEPYFLSVSPLLDQGREAWDGGHIAVLTVANPLEVPTIDPRMLVEFFGITPTEAEIAAALGSGHTVVCIAKQRGVATNTVYAHIKKIIEKTGYTGQADIARRVSDLSRIFGNRGSIRERT